MNRFKNKEVIIADVDDTICYSTQVISDSMAIEVEKLIRNGYTMAFISGTGVKELINMISFKVMVYHHILAASGMIYAKIYNDSSVSLVYQHPLKKEEKKEIIGALNELIEVFNITTMTNKDDQILDRDSQVTLSAIGRHAPSKFKESFDPNRFIRTKWIYYLKSILGDKYDLKIGGTTSIDITRKGDNKKKGILMFTEYNNIDLDTVLFFGDKLLPGGNDFVVSEVVKDCIQVNSPKETLQYFRQLNNLRR